MPAPVEPLASSVTDGCAHVIGPFCVSDAVGLAFTVTRYEAEAVQPLAFVIVTVYVVVVLGV